ncbi:MAG: glycosyltransferase [bacterium]|nr:glycosyltransferase [bacterium]
MSIFISEKKRLEAVELAQRAERELAKTKERLRSLEDIVATLRRNYDEEIDKKTEDKINALMQSKTWRLGCAINNCKTIKDFLALPFELWKLKKSLPEDDFSLDQPVAAANEEIVQPEVLNAEEQAWMSSMLEKASRIPDSNGCKYYVKSSLRIGIVCDQFFFDSINAAADFVYLTPENWREEIEKGIDVFLYVSTWHGLNNEWHGIVGVQKLRLKFFRSFWQGDGHEESTCENALRDEQMNIFNECHRRNIPTIFYSKEDPPNFWLFAEFAPYCDYVFTSSQECIAAYKEYINLDGVEAVSFGINPLVHNPIGFRSAPKGREVLFSGSWMLKYPRRCEELAGIFDGVLATDYALHIIDRNFPLNKKLAYPEPYINCVSPALPHDLLQKVHKMADWAVNINSVKASRTMFANRSFELQANGVLLLSNFSIGVNSMLPNISMVYDSAEVGRILHGFTPEEVYERQIAGIRSVMSGHTCYDRMRRFLKPAGLKFEQPVRRILVLVEELTENVIRSFERQTYEEKTLRCAQDVKPGDLKAYDMLAWFDKHSEYEEFYLEDMSNAFKYTACDYVTKDAWKEGGVLHEGIEHNYVERMESKYRTLFWIASYSCRSLMRMKDGIRLKNGYSIDHFNYDAKPCKTTFNERSYTLTIIVPVRNNGRQLYGKCFSGLRCSSLFEEMEILFVDTGSTDPYTLKIENWLARRYSNIRMISCEDAGKEAFAAAIQTGLSVSTAPYVAVLFPEDEAVGDGYAGLYHALLEQGGDAAMGNMYACDVTTQLVDNYDVVIKTLGRPFIERKDDFFDNNASFAPRIQTMLMAKGWMQEVLCPQSDAADTPLEGVRLMHLAKKIILVNTPVLAAYIPASNAAELLPVPRLEELFKVNKDAVNIKVSYDLFASKIIFYNKWNGGENARFAWSILAVLKDNEKVHQSKYRKDTTFAYSFSQLEEGFYAVKAFVKDEDRKFSEEVALVHVFADKTFQVEKEYSSASRRNVLMKNVEINIVPVGNGICHVSAKGRFSVYADFAWHVFRQDESKPCFKSEFSLASERLLTLTESGTYKVKLICRVGKKKGELLSEPFDVDVTEDSQYV